MQKIIGLDIGSYSIKAVEILNRFKTYEISNFYENEIPVIDDISPDVTIPACMEQLFRENNLEADRIITAMPGQYISSRILPFSFSDPRKIEAALYSEVEDVVPFDLDEMIIDHQILGQMDGKTATLVAMTRKEFLASFLEHLQRIDIDPKLVDVDSLSFYNLSPYLEMEPGKCYGVVDVGHEKTSVCLVQDGVLRMFRSINLGGRYITEFLARDMEIPFNDAQRIKHQVSRVLTLDSQAGDSEEDRIADRITMASNTIIKDLGRTLYAFKTWEKSPIEKIYISGGTSQIRDFDLYLAEHLDVPTEHSRLEESDLRINDQVLDQMPVMSQGISIGLRAVSSIKRHSQINLRKGEFAYVQDYESVFKAGEIAFKVIGFALLLLGFSYVALHFSYAHQIKQLEDSYKGEVFKTIKDKVTKRRLRKRDFPRLRREASSILKNRIASNREATDGFIRFNSDSGALVVLAKVSEFLPKEVKVNVTEYRYESRPDFTGKVKIRIEADSFETVSLFQSALEKVPVLAEVVEKSSDGKPGTDIKVAVFEALYNKTI